MAESLKDKIVETLLAKHIELPEFTAEALMPVIEAEVKELRDDIKRLGSAIELLVKDCVC